MNSEQFDATPLADPTWLDTATEYASTPEGHDRLAEQVEEAEVFGDSRRAARLRAALARGKALSIARDDAARLSAPSRPRT